MKYCKVKERKDSSLLSECTLVKYSFSLIFGSVMCFLRKYLSYHYLLKMMSCQGMSINQKTRSTFYETKIQGSNLLHFWKTSKKTLNLIKCTFFLLLVLIFIAKCMIIHGEEFNFQSITP